MHPHWTKKKNEKNAYSAPPLVQFRSAYDLY